jgi:glycosyltransferase involved in cell wall biosynthesis
MMPRISVIVTTYNSGRYVGETLASVAAQTFRDFEVVVADDGSSDDTLEIARASGVVKDIVTGSNLGIGGNWARAFSHSRGELVAFVAGDDRWLPEHLETAVAAFERDPAAGVSFTDIRLIDEHGCLHVASRTVKRREPRSGFVSPEEIVRSNFINGTSAVVRRAALTRAGGIDPCIWLAELDLFIRIVVEYPVVYTPVVTAEYRVRFDGLAHDYQRGLEGRLQILEKHVRPGRQKRVLVARAYIAAAYGQLWPRPSIESVALARANLTGAFRAWPPVLVSPLFLAMAVSTASGPAYVALAPRLHSVIVSHPAKLVVRRLLGMTR